MTVEQTADNCIKCNICNTVCPVSAVTDLFPGPKYEGPQGQRFRAGIDGDDSPDASLDYCSACGLCTQACPEGVLIAEINSIARSKLVAAKGGLPLRDRLVSRPAVLGTLARPVAPLANLMMRSRLVRAVLERAIGVHRDASMPHFSAMSFRSWARSHRPGTATTAESGGRSQTIAAAGTTAESGGRSGATAAAGGTMASVAYFHGCATQQFEPEVGAALVRVLERSGIAVTLPRQGCCGLPLISNGDFDSARGYARKLVRRLLPAAGDPGVIVANSTSCGMTLKAKYRELLAMEDADTTTVSRAVYDICELLIELHDRGELHTGFGELRARALYHPPCQLMAHGVGTPALDLLALVPGLEVELSRSGCCGTAGTYGTKVEKYQIAMDVGRPLFEQVAAGRFEFVVCDSETCRWHIARSTGLPVYHPVQVLDRAYHLAGG